MAKKARGTRGSWFATVDGEALPCVHKHWSTRGRYRDPYVTPNWSAKNDKFAEAVIEKRRVVMTIDDVTERPGGIDFKRKGYVATWEVEDVTYDDQGLQFRFTRRLDELV